MHGLYNSCTCTSCVRTMDQVSYLHLHSNLLSSNRKKDKCSNINNVPRGEDKSSWIKTPSKIRKSCFESNTVPYNSEAKLDIYPRDVISESPAKRRKLDSGGQSTKMANIRD